MVKFCLETHSLNQKYVIPRHGKHIQSSHKFTSSCAVGVFFSGHKQQVGSKNEEKIMQRVAHKYKALWGLQEGVQSNEEKEG